MIEFKVFNQADVEKRAILVDTIQSLRSSDSGKSAIRARMCGSFSFPTVLEALVDNSVTYQVFVYRENQIAGWGEYVIDSQDEHIAEISLLIVPEFQGQHLGSALAHHLINTCAEVSKTVTLIRAVTCNDNRASRRLCNSLRKVMGGTLTTLETDETMYLFPVAHAVMFDF